MNKVSHNFYFSQTDDHLHVKGFQEAVISVSEFEKYIAFLENHFGWEVVYRGHMDSSIFTLWHLDNNMKAEEAVLRNPGTQSGYLRVIKFHDVEQRLIRSSANTWDTGGIFDLNVRVHNMDFQYLDFEKQGWNGFSKPHRYTFDIYDVSEVLMKGPDGIVFAGIQRFHPPLIGFDFQKVSRIFNSSLITNDIDAAHDFYYHKLGFTLSFQTTGDNRPEGANVLGIPPNINHTVRAPINIYKPDPESYGSIELIQFLDLEGEHHATHAVPPNLGILMLRFPIRKAEDYMSFIQKNGINVNTEASDIYLPPYGQVNFITIRTTEGAWFEFIELIEE